MPPFQIGVIVKSVLSHQFVAHEGAPLCIFSLLLALQYFIEDTMQITIEGAAKTMHFEFFIFCTLFCFDHNLVGKVALFLDNQRNILTNVCKIN
jgi:hypothetical protein